MKILIGADLVPTESNYHLFQIGAVDELIGCDLKMELRNADFTIFNLEVPLTDEVEPIEKCGPNLRAPVDTIKGLKSINPHFFSLANNHILDQGRHGLENTIAVLDRAGIRYAGAGANLEEAKKPYIVEIQEIKVGIYCCAEHEFTIAKEHEAGANPYDPLESFDHISQLKQKCDFVIILYHGGKEYYRYPSPNLQKVCRKFVEKGADFVVCQHSHCIGAMEEWKVESGQKGVIVYGQGNFLFDYSESEFWKTSLLIRLNILKDMSGQIQLNYEYIPLQKNREKVEIASDWEQILAEFYDRSEHIKDINFVNSQFQSFAKSMEKKYLRTFCGSGSRNYLYRICNRISGCRIDNWFIKKKYNRKDKLALRNYIECEAHRELLICLLEHENNKKVNQRGDKL